MMGITYLSAYRAVRGGNIPSIRLGRAIFIPKKSVRDLFGGENPAA